MQAFQLHHNVVEGVTGENTTLATNATMGPILMTSCNPNYSPTSTSKYSLQMTWGMKCPAHHGCQGHTQATAWFTGSQSGLHQDLRISCHCLADVCAGGHGVSRHEDRPLPALVPSSSPTHALKEVWTSDHHSVLRLSEDRVKPSSHRPLAVLEHSQRAWCPEASCQPGPRPGLTRVLLPSLGSTSASCHSSREIPEVSPIP